MANKNAARQSDCRYLKQVMKSCWEDQSMWLARSAQVSWELLVVSVACLTFQKQVLKSLSYFRDWWSQDQAHVGYQVRQHDTIGQDCVAMCADIIAAGANLFTSLTLRHDWQNEPAKLEQVVAGEGAMQAGAALIGGETAEMPGMYGEDDYDLAGLQSVWLKNLKS